MHLPESEAFDRSPRTTGSGTGPAPSSASSPVEDLDRVEEARAGDPGAIEWLEERLIEVPRNLRAIDRRFGGGLDVHDLDDLAQETMLKAWNRMDRYTGHSTLGAWLHRFCTFEYLNALRRKNRSPRAVDIESAPQARVAEEPVALGDLADKMQRMPENMALILQLRHFEGLDFATLGTRLGISAPAAKTRYYRSLRHLKSLFGQPTPDA